LFSHDIKISADHGFSQVGVDSHMRLMFDMDIMKKRHIEQFPKECVAAFENRPISFQGWPRGRCPFAAASGKWTAQGGSQRVVTWIYILLRH